MYVSTTPPKLCLIIMKPGWIVPWGYAVSNIFLEC